MAVTILSSSLVLSLAAAQAGVRAGRAADETRRAEMLLRERLEGSAGRLGVWRGRDQGLDWRVEARTVGDAARAGAGAAEPCERVATARAGSRGRTYRLATVEVCAADPQKTGPQTGGAGA